ncbi:NADH oxidase [Fusarium sp. NRRL 52700]|nr:NADH oxidase [Fusarium sp. NRRL 52700]
MKDVLPDVYQFAISGKQPLHASQARASLVYCLHHSVANSKFQGLCRINGTAKKTCVGHFPGSLNLTEAVIQDIDNFKHCGLGCWNETLEQHCKDEISRHVIDYKGAETLDHLMVAFLILSILTNAASFYVIYRTGAICHVYTTLILSLDAMLLFASFAFCFVVMSYEVGPYVEEIPLQKFSDIQMIGPGFWALLGILVIRIFTNPPMLWGVIPMLIPVVGVFGFLAHMKGFFTLIRTTVLSDLSRMSTT